MPRKVINNVALAASVLLLPGGFILGAALGARYYAKRRADRQAAADADAAGASAKTL